LAPAAVKDMPDRQAPRPVRQRSMMAVALGLDGIAW
jgi:hypothetical protein